MDDRQARAFAEKCKICGKGVEMQSLQGREKAARAEVIRGTGTSTRQNEKRVKKNGCVRCAKV